MLYQTREGASRKASFMMQPKVTTSNGPPPPPQKNAKKRAKEINYATIGPWKDEPVLGHVILLKFAIYIYDRPAGNY